MVFKVFISSTQEDLGEYRQAAKEAALKTGFFPVLSESWAASGRMPLAASLAQVSECDLVIVIVAHRYGWVPGNQAEGEHKSITRLECEKALAEGKEVIPLLLEEDAAWPAELREEYAAVKALQKGLPTSEEISAIRKGMEGLANFKAWLNDKGIRGKFRTPADVKSEVVAALSDWHMRRLENGDKSALPELDDAGQFLRSTFEWTRYIDIRGLQVGSGRAHRFPIEDLYIPLSFKGEAAGATAQGGGDSQLKSLLTKQRVVIIGDPGSGKTTMLRRVAHSLSAALLGIGAEQAAADLGLSGEPKLPIFIRCSDLTHFLETAIEAKATEALQEETPEYLIRFLESMSRQNAWGLGAEFYKRTLEGSGCMLLLDGLDEAPTVQSRVFLARMVEACAERFEHTQFFLTSRPKAYTSETTLRSFEKVDVQPLPETSIRTFLKRWCDGLYSQSANALGDKHYEELVEALDQRPEIRKMATNPVMLTALAVVHWNDRTIPEQRAELYESIITWLSRARQERGGRMPADRCVYVLQSLAMAMQDGSQGRQVEISRSSAAELLSNVLTPHEFSRPKAAEAFLVEEELDSGIIVGRGDNVRFWHLSFQEFLAARAIAALRETDQVRLLLSNSKKVLSPEWRETVLLLAGILHRQGPAKVRAMLEAILESGPENDALAKQAQVVGLVGAVQRDLTAVRFRLEHPRYEKMIKRVMEIFDATATSKVPIEIRLEAADALGQAGDPRLGLTIWVKFPAGTFLVGVQGEDPESPSYDACALVTESPPREVRLRSFDMARFPVTVGEYSRFIAEDGYRERELWKAGGFGKWESPDRWADQLAFSNRPVAGISWFEAMAYACWRGESIRLPRADEWERAARGGTQRLYPWGDTAPSDELLNFAAGAAAGNSSTHVTPVGFYPLGATPEGLLDMAGNVFEWCLDAEQPGGEAGKHHRAVRGGAYNSVPLFVRAAFRGRYLAESRKDYIGFRLCRLGGADMDG